jgi:DNA-binding transcriptional MerR regulator
MNYIHYMKSSQTNCAMKSHLPGKSGWRVGELARLAGVSIRTLHHYDAIGLLRPAQRNGCDYRIYGHNDLLRLQQILFYRELDLSLEEIKEILEAPGFEMAQALRDHRYNLQKRQRRLADLIATIDRTLESFCDKEKSMKDYEYYQGFIDPETAGEYDREARQKYGNENVEASWHNIRKMGKPAFQALMNDGEEINRKLAALMHLEPDSSEVQVLIAEHHRFIGRFYTPTPEIYAGLAEIYVSDSRFTAYYEKFAPGLARFLAAGMKAFLQNRS